MRLSDMIRQSLQNLLRHKGRTFLTVLGVIVGCCSVVSLVSIGIGYSQVQQASLEQMGDLTKIYISVPYTDSGKKLDDTVVSQLKGIDHIKAIIPKVSYYETTMYAGNQERYKATYFEITGESYSNLELEGYELLEGEWAGLDKKNEIVVGEHLAYSLMDTMRPEGHNYIDIDAYYDWETQDFYDLPDPYIDLTNKTVKIVFGYEYEDSEEKTLSVEMKVGGVMKNTEGRWSSTDNGVFMDIDTLLGLLDKYELLNGNKKRSEQGYDSITVKADEIKNVESVEKEIQRNNLSTYSMDDMRKSTENMVRQAELMLGGIGAIALFVAALGIANTMIMAITERIREIGIMKALGCFIRNIREMFLLEAGFIGLIGGMIGIGLSFMISFLLNRFAPDLLFAGDYGYMMDPGASKISVIPWWLALFAVLFSMLVGIVAGLYPARRAVRISVLDAIRHE